MGRVLLTCWTAASVVGMLFTAGCGGDDGDSGNRAARTLNVHVSANLSGRGAHFVRAERLAVEQAGRRAGVFKIRVVVHDESSLGNDYTDPERVRRNAEAAAGDRDAIAYVGDINSSSTAISAPILNHAGLLQVTPNSTYVGLTRSEGAAPGEPGKYHPTGRRTLARVVPADHIQARAGVVYARELGVKRLGVVADETSYGQGLAKLVLSAARDVGLDVIDRGTGADLGKRAQSATAAGADAVYFAACSPPDQMLEFAGRHRGSKVFTGDCYTTLVDASPKELAPFDDRFFMTVPGGGLEKTPAGRDWFERWRKRIGTPPDDELMFAYEAMLAVIAAITRAGDDGDDRAAVVREFFATRDRDSILGRYSIDRNGDTTLRSYGGFAIRDGKLRFDRVLDTGG